jgi:hypothetical protein
MARTHRPSLAVHRLAAVDWSLIRRYLVVLLLQNVLWYQQSQLRFDIDHQRPKRGDVRDG